MRTKARRTVTTLLAFLSLLCFACRQRGFFPASSAGSPPAARDVPWEADLLSVARAYRGWDRVSDASWAPWLCFAPPPTGALRSASADPDTHGRKLYFLYTEHGQFYCWILPRGVEPEIGEGSTALAPVGFAIVKEAWAPVEVELSEVPRLQPRSGFERTIPAEYLVEDSKAYRTGEPRGLFIMLKKDPATPGTDEGWVYGTVSADGKTVTSSGRVEACMSCHRDASRDRLFGMHLQLQRR